MRIIGLRPVERNGLRGFVTTFHFGNSHSPDSSSHQVNSPASTSSPGPGTPFQAKASEDNGAENAPKEGGRGMAGEVSRVDAGRTASATSEDGRDGPERRAPIPAGPHFRRVPTAIRANQVLLMAA